MKQLTFNNQSWHYKLAKMAGYSPKSTYIDEYGDEYKTGEHDTDICAYTRRVVLGSFMLAFLGMVTGIVGFVFWHVVFGIIFSIIMGTWFFTEIGIAGLTMIVALSFVGLWILGTIKYGEYKDKKRWTAQNSTLPVKPDNFVKHAYKSWKGKFCMQINFVDKNEKVKDGSDSHFLGV